MADEAGPAAAVPLTLADLPGELARVQGELGAARVEEERRMKAARALFASAKAGVRSAEVALGRLEEKRGDLLARVNKQRQDNQRLVGVLGPKMEELRVLWQLQLYAGLFREVHALAQEAEAEEGEGEGGGDDGGDKALRAVVGLGALVDKLAAGGAPYQNLLAVACERLVAVVPKVRAALNRRVVGALAAVGWPAPVDLRAHDLAFVRHAEPWPQFCVDEAGASAMERVWGCASRLVALQLAAEAAHRHQQDARARARAPSRSGDHGVEKEHEGEDGEEGEDGREGEGEGEGEEEEEGEEEGEESEGDGEGEWEDSEGEGEERSGGASGLLARQRHHRRRWHLPQLWITEELLLPIASRFRHHFHRSCSTNRLEKPEWYFTHALKTLHAHSPFLARVLHPLLAAHGLAGVTAEQDFARGVVAMVRRKLVAAAPAIAAGGAVVLSRTLNEALNFDASVRVVFGEGARARTCVDTLANHPDTKAKWVEVERSVARERIAALKLTTSGAAWRGPTRAGLVAGASAAHDDEEGDEEGDEDDGCAVEAEPVDGADGDDGDGDGGGEGGEFGDAAPHRRSAARPQGKVLTALTRPVVASEAIEVVQGFVERTSLLSSPTVLAAFVDLVLVPFVDELVGDLRTVWLRKVCRTSSRADTHPLLAGIVNTAVALADHLAHTAALPQFSAMAVLELQRRRDKDKGRHDKEEEEEGEEDKREEEEEEEESDEAGAFAEDAVHPLFVAMQASLEDLVDDVLTDVCESIKNEFVELCVGYCTRRDLWSRSGDVLAAPREGGGNGGVLDISPELCASLDCLKHHLTCLHHELEHVRFSRVWMGVAELLDAHLLQSLLLRMPFGLHGARQVQHDMRSLFVVFGAYAPHPHTFLRRVHEACVLLNLPDADLEALLCALHPHVALAVLEREAQEGGSEDGEGGGEGEGEGEGGGGGVPALGDVLGLVGVSCLAEKDVRVLLGSASTRAQSVLAALTRRAQGHDD